MFLKQRKKFGVLKIEEYTKGGIFMKKQGFTLAEVLITLVIIGIIAAMTLPSLLGGTNKQEIKTGLQKAMSTLSQAITLHYALTGEDFSTGGDNVSGFVTTRLNIKDRSSDNNVVISQDGMVYDFAQAFGAETASSDKYVLVDVNGRKGPTSSSNTTVTADTSMDSQVDNLAQIKDVFKIYTYGTTVTVSKPTTSGDVTTFSRTAATDLLEDCLTANGNSCKSGSEDGGT